jgi:hypothetical protein
VGNGAGQWAVAGKEEKKDSAELFSDQLLLSELNEIALCLPTASFNGKSSGT